MGAAGAQRRLADDGEAAVGAEVDVARRGARGDAMQCGDAQFIEDEVGPEIIRVLLLHTPKQWNGIFAGDAQPITQRAFSVEVSPLTMFRVRRLAPPP